MRSVSMVQPHQSDRVMATPQSSVVSSAQVSTWAQERLAAGLAMIAGYVDAYGYITFKTYLSFMSGNTTQTGSQIGQGDLAAAMPSLLAIVFLVIGVFTGTLLTHSGTHQSWRLRFRLVVVLLAGVLRVSPPWCLSHVGGRAPLHFVNGHVENPP